MFFPNLKDFDVQLLHIRKYWRKISHKHACYKIWRRTTTFIITL